MSSTVKADINFIPQVAAGHIQAAFERQMGIGRLAVLDTTLASTQRGDTATFPFWKKIGAAEEPTEAGILTIDKMSDDKFSVTVKEVAKAVGWKDAAKMKSGATNQEIEAEVYRQIGQVFAEKVDVDLIAACEVAANHVKSFDAAAAADTMNINNYIKAKMLGFGDQSDKAVAMAMHSLHLMDFLTSNPNAFKDATSDDPFYGAAGFQGRLVGGTAIFVSDTMPEVVAVGGKKTFAGYIFKPEPLGIYWGANMNVEKDRDILAREDVWAATGWYGVLGLHGKVSAADKRIARFTMATSQASA